MKIWVGSKLTSSSLPIPIPNKNAYYVQKISCKSEDNTHVFVYCLALVYVKLYFWILQGVYCLLFRVRQWRKSTFTVLYIVPSLMPRTVWSENNSDDAEDSSTLQRILKYESHCKSIFWCSHATCVSPYVCNTNHSQRLPYLFLFAAFNHALC